MSVFSHGGRVWCFTRFFLRGVCLLITSGSKSVQRDSAKLGSLKLYIFSKGVKCKFTKKSPLVKPFETSVNN